MTTDSRKRPPAPTEIAPVEAGPARSLTASVDDLPPYLPLGPSEHKTKTELALEAIRAAIMQGRMRPGARLTLTQLSSLLGMSITPIREAARVLEADGLVSYEAHKGMWVTDLSAEQSRELTLLRARLEGLATELAIPKLTQDDVAELVRLQSVMVKAAAERDDRSMTQANLDWHYGIYRAAQTQFVLRQISKLWIPYGWSSIWHDDLRATAIRQHADIHTAIDARDAQRAGQLMYEHILWVTDPTHWKGSQPVTPAETI